MTDNGGPVGEREAPLCPMGNLPVMANLKAACPDCGRMVDVCQIGDVWVFAIHAVHSGSNREPL